ncbi:uncharacterized protein CLAFUR5_14571 [Fulvia fulva]|uniref:Uncharacterized protein n=1 Tax=Passalora fulva TaxID=5499 RepID=A0A9Q8PMA4_PASFU|nr:uncharacterized protein CLAFUR5_14571 [Fulvia fulva]UJO25051.1 hypothetical protein CLAFUR5_14571 [Fulvia fulva]
MRTLVSFWLLGDFLKDAAFQNAAMRQLLRQSRQVAMEGVDVALEISGLVAPEPRRAPPHGAGDKAGEERAARQTWEGNPLQRWSIDLLAPVVTKRHVEEMQWAWSKEFLVALFVRMLEMPAGGRLEMVPSLEGGRGVAYMVMEEG